MIWKAFCNLSECKTLNDKSFIIYFGLIVDEIRCNKYNQNAMKGGHPKEAGL